MYPILNLFPQIIFWLVLYRAKLIKLDKCIWTQFNPQPLSLHIVTHNHRMVDMSFAHKSGGISRSRTSFYRIGFDTIRNKIKNGCKIRRLFIIYSHYCTALQERIRRNDPCPCNSNKKYKDCHMRSIFNPREIPRHSS